MRFTVSLLAAAALGVSGAHAADARVDVLPDAGQSLRDIEQRPLPLPPRQTLELDLPDSPAEGNAEGGPLVQVAAFVLEGNVAIASAELLPLLADLQGRSVPLGQLQAGANRITRLYRERGYPLARAYLPAQEIDQGVVRIAVLEGRYGQVRIDNAAGLAADALAPLAALHPGDAVQAESLERSLLLLQDLPGVSLRSTLKPGDAVGSSDLHVEVLPAGLVSGSVELDNFGSRYTGAYRLGGTLNLNNPLGFGDRLTLRALGSDEAQHYARIAYQLPVGPWGTQFGAAYGYTDYDLARDFDALDGHGFARTASAYLIQPLLRGRSLSVWAQLQFNDKRLSDSIGEFDYRNDKRARTVTASLVGNSRDTLFGGGINSFSIAWTQGRLRIDDMQLRLEDSLSARSHGAFGKFNPSVVRLQRLSDAFSLYGQLQGQWARTNLDSSEKFSLGGAYGVRAYPQGEAVGDEGWLANVELRYALSSAWQLSAFVDHGRIRFDKDPWSDDDNHRSLSGAGAGASWTAGGWQLSAMAAWKLGEEKTASDSERSPRIWAQVVRSF